MAEQRAAVRALEQARPHRLAVLAAEQLLLDALGLHRRSADDDERRGAARAPVVEHARGDLLADARGSGQQHAAARRGDALQRRAHAVDRARRALQLLVATRAFTQRRVLAAQSVGLGRAFDEQDQPLGLERLFDEVDRAAPDRRHCGVDVAMPRYDEHRQRRVARLYDVEQFEPVELRPLQPDVEQDERWPALVERGECCIAVGGDARFIAFVLEHARDQFADVAFVVDDQDVERHASALPEVG